MDGFIRYESIIRRALTVAIIGLAGYGVVLITDANTTIDKAEQVIAKPIPPLGPKPDCTNLQGDAAGKCILDYTFYGMPQFVANNNKQHAEAAKAAATEQEDTGWNYLLIAIFLWPAYMIIRWIITGRSKPETIEQ